MTHLFFPINHRSTAMRFATAAGLSLMLALSGCATKRMTTGSVNRHSKPMEKMSMSELKAATNYWQKQYTKDPKNKMVGLNFATALRTIGRNEQALAVMRELAINYPKDLNVLAAYGKALAGAGKLKHALNVIRRAQRPDNPDWRLHSAAGAIYDQLGKPKRARNEYRKALDIKQGEASVLSNLGMSYLLTGDLKSSETYLQQAIKRPGADSRVRQNLALVVGLQGRFKEAETVAAGELPPEEAQANITFLRQMLAEQNSWGKLKKSG